MREIDHWAGLTHSIDSIRQKTERISEKHRIITLILEERLKLLQNDTDQLLSGSYTTTDIREIPSLLAYIYQDPAISSIHMVTRIGTGYFGSWGGGSTKKTMIALTLGAKRRGVDVYHLFAADDWLRLATDNEAFDLSKSLVLAGAVVRVTDQRQAFQDAPTDFSTYFGQGWYGYVTYFEDDTSGSGLYRMRLLIQQTTETQKCEALFQGLWESAQPLEML